MPDAGARRFNRSDRKILIDEIMLIDDVPDHVKSQQRLSQGNRLGLVKLEVFL